MFPLLFGELAKLAREIIDLVRKGKLPRRELEQLIMDARVGKFDRDQRKRTGES